MNTYFSGCITTAEVKARYRELAMKWHPDRGGDNRTMQIINDQYHSILKGKHETAEMGSDGREHTYYYNEAHEQAIIEKIAELLRLDLPGCEIWLIGKWVWVMGDTKPVKDLLGKNGAGLTFHSKRKCWYWKPTIGKHYYNKRASLSDLANTYGAKKFATQAKEQENRQRASGPALAAG